MKVELRPPTGWRSAATIAWIKKDAADKPETTGPLGHAFANLAEPPELRRFRQWTGVAPAPLSGKSTDGGRAMAESRI